MAASERSIRRQAVVGYPDCLGPMPRAALAALIDLGLTDLDIALYFRLDFRLVTLLTHPLRRAAA